MVRPVLALAALVLASLTLTGCGSKPAGSAKAPRQADDFGGAYVTAPVSVQEGDVVEVQILNASGQEEECRVEIFASRGADDSNPRRGNQATFLAKVDTHTLKGHFVATTEYKVKTAGLCWVEVKVDTGDLIPQVSFRKEKAAEPRLVYKANDFRTIPVRRARYGSTGRAGYGSTGKAGGTGVYRRPATGRAGAATSK